MSKVIKHLEPSPVPISCGSHWLHGALLFVNFRSTDITPHEIFAVRNFCCKDFFREDFSSYGIFPYDYVAYVISQTIFDVWSKYVGPYNCISWCIRSYWIVKKWFRIKQMLYFNSWSKPFQNVSIFSLYPLHCFTPYVKTCRNEISLLSQN